MSSVNGVQTTALLCMLLTSRQLKWLRKFDGMFQFLQTRRRVMPINGVYRHVKFIVQTDNFHTAAAAVMT
jgi:hypothetical protein